MKQIPSSRLVAFLFAALVAPSVRAQDASSPPAIRREFRGVWVASVANIDWPSRPGLPSGQQQTELTAILDRAVALNLNAIVLQVRPSGDALYASPYEPWSAYLTGQEGRAPEPYYDPLQFAVREAHARGLELHAWFNPYRARHASATGTHAATHLSVTHPELVRRYGKYEWMDPGEPAVIAQTLRVMLDVVRRYDVDGIHIDDYFYPYPERGTDSLDVPFPDSASYARYQRTGGRLARDDWRRHNVDTLVQQIYLRTKALKPWVQVGISPFGIWRPGNPASIAGFDSYAKLYGDSRRWLREGWVDYFTPQLYWPIRQTAQSYPVLLDWWLGENVHRRHIWPGNISSRAATGGGLWTASELNDQVRATRSAGAGGNVFFSMRSLMPVSAVRRDSVLVGVATQPPPPASAELVATRLYDELYREPALVPASAWLARGRPAVPAARAEIVAATGELLVRRTDTDRGVFGWWTVRTHSADGWHAWVVPNAQRAVLVRRTGEGDVDRVVVSAVDRLGMESVALSVAIPR